MADVVLTPKHVRLLTGSIPVRKIFNSVGGYVGDWVSFDDDNCTLTDADTGTTVSGLVGQIVSGSRHDPTGALIQGETVDVVVLGPVSYGPNVTLDETKQYFISNTPGKMSDTAGTIVRRCGAPLSSNVFFVNPSSTPATSS